MRIALALVSMPLLLAACSGEECESDKDCIGGFTCENNECVRASGNPGPLDGGVRDLGVTDRGMLDGAEDAGDGPADAEIDGGADLGVPDGGAPDGAGPSDDGGRLDGYDGGTDGGMLEPVVLPSGGLITYSELQSTAYVAVERAEFFDRSNAMYGAIERRFPDGFGGECVVRVERLLGGQTLGITADRIELSDGTTTRVWRPTMNEPGRFLPATPATESSFARQADIGLEIVSNGVAGTLTGARHVLGEPVALLPSAPSPGMTLSLLTTQQLSWLSGGQALPVAIEVYDANREVVLTCEAINTGFYTIPIDAIRAWYTEGPAVPAYLEIGFTLEEDVALRLNGTTATLPTKIRTRRGARYAVQ